MKLHYFIAFLLFAAPVFGQQMAHTDGKGYVADMLNVRFAEGTVLQLEGKTLLVNGMNAIPSTIADFGYWKPQYNAAPAELDRLWQNAQKNLAKRLPDPKAAFRFHLYDAANRDRLVKELNALSFVKRASIVPVPMPAAAPDFENDQLFIQNGEPGINAKDVWTTYNNRGSGVKICDIEYTFNEQHVDLPAITILGGIPEDPFGGTTGDHGTAVFGEMGSLDNGTGTTGIAADATFFFAPAFIDGIYDFENAVLNALTELETGDLMLIEQQLAGPNYTGISQYGYVPMEWYEPYYDAIQLAVGNGIIVIEAAGNGSEDLDDPIYSMDNDGHYPFLEGNGSGAIVVGAGAVGDQDVSRSKLWFSNYGSCLHVQGNGEGVTTTGYGDLYDTEGFDAWYTGDFGGTSSASPIVTGAAALLQSVYEEETGERMDRDELLGVLIATGKPQVEGVLYPLSNHIGPLPDVPAAIAFLMDHLGTDELPTAGLTVYPNPGNGTFMLKGKGTAANAAIVIRDLTGKTIGFQSQPAGQNVLQIQLENGATGIYFLEYSGTDGNFVEKISVKH